MNKVVVLVLLAACACWGREPTLKEDEVVINKMISLARKGVDMGSIELTEEELNGADPEQMKKYASEAKEAEVLCDLLEKGNHMNVCLETGTASEIPESEKEIVLEL